MDARAEGSPKDSAREPQCRELSRVSVPVRACPLLGICNAHAWPEKLVVLRNFMRAGSSRGSFRGRRRGRSAGARAALFGLGLFVGASLLLYRHNLSEGEVSASESVHIESELGNFYALIIEESRVRELFDERLKEMRQTGGYEGEGTAIRVERFSPAIDSPCGTEGFRRGSFYCARDGRTYIDLREIGEAKPSPHYRLSKLAGYHALNQTGRLDALLRRHRRSPERVEPLLLLEYEAECAAGALSRSLVERAVITRRGLLDGIERYGGAGSALLPELPTPAEPPLALERRALFEKGLDSARIETCERFAREALVSKIRG